MPLRLFIIQSKKFAKYRSIFFKMSSVMHSIDTKRGKRDNTVIDNKKFNRLKLFTTFLVVYIFSSLLCESGFLTNNVGVTAQHIDCTAGYLCDFFRRFPHLPFSRLHSENLGYIRTLDYMISKDKDVVPHQHYSTNSAHTDNYYKNELSEIRTTPLLRIPASSNPPIYRPSNGRKYEPKVNISETIQ